MIVIANMIARVARRWIFALRQVFRISCRVMCQSVDLVTASTVVVDPLASFLFVWMWVSVEIKPQKLDARSRLMAILNVKSARLLNCHNMILGMSWEVRAFSCWSIWGG